jgi:hypothetical protein
LGGGGGGFEVDDALQLNDDLVGHEDGDVYVGGDDENDDENEKDDDLKYVEEMPHVFVAPTPNPEPEELEGGFMFGAASCGVGSSSNIRPREDAEDVAPSSRPMTGTFGPNQRDFRLTVPSIVTSWAQQSVAEISVPASGRASASNFNGIQDENQRGSRERGDQRELG